MVAPTAAAASSQNDPLIDNKRSAQIVFFDVETTFPSGPGEKPKLLEFGAIVVAAQGLRELESYSTLIRQPGVSSMGIKFKIAQKSIVHLPAFVDVADDVFNLLNGRIWAGHNILNFDMVCIREAFSSVTRPAPQPVGVLDTLPLLRETFGPRAGNLKLATLAKYCGLGKQEHRSLADVRLNLEVLKHCATMLLLESKSPDNFPVPRLSTRSVYSSVLQSSAARSDLQSSQRSGLQSSSRSMTRWEQIMQNPRIKTNFTMKRRARPLTSSSTASNRAIVSPILRRETRLSLKLAKAPIQPTIITLA